MAGETIRQQAMVVGTILHGGTGLPVDGTITITSADGPILTHVRPNGDFAVSGRPWILFPDLATVNRTLHLTIRAESEQWKAGFFEKNVNVLLAAGEDFRPPVSAGVINLNAEPVNIRGRVRSGVEPYPAVNAAVVELRSNAVVVANTATLPDGSYAFNLVNIVAPVDVRVSDGAFVTQIQALAVDYSLPVNEVNFRMTPV